jgi:hypothetical protein
MNGDDWDIPVATPPRADRGRRGLVRRAARVAGVDRLVKAYVLPRLEASEASHGKLTWEELAVRELEKSLEPILETDGPIIAGPWMSELGFEVLYWIPFLRWLVDRFEIEPARLTAVSRGGVGSWYTGICDGYVESFDRIEPAEFRRLVEGRWDTLGGQKQVSFGSWDEELLERVGPDDWRTATVLHPSVMYRLFRRVWRNSIRLEHVFDHASYARFPVPTAEGLPDLPDSFVAVKFYFRSSFPDSDANRQLAESVVQSLAAHTEVVLLNTRTEFDEHVELEPAVSQRLLRPLEQIPAARNLAVQSAIISRSDGFLGTYGGLSYVATCYGIPSLALYSAANYLPQHLEVAVHAAAKLGAPFAAVDRTLLSALGRSVGSGDVAA